MESYREPGSSNPFTLLFESVFDSQMRGVMVCLPGYVTAFDAELQRAQVQVSIQRVVDGTPENMTILKNVPVQFSGDGEWYFWHQITPGETEGLLHFSQRAIDTWIEQGGSTAPVDFRMFDANDAFFAPGYRSNPNVIPDFVNDGCGMSNYSGTTRIHLTDAGVDVTSGYLRHNGVNVGSTHVHAQGNDSDNNSQQNTEVPQ